MTFQCRHSGSPNSDTTAPIVRNAPAGGLRVRFSLPTQRRCDFPARESHGGASSWPAFHPSPESFVTLSSSTSGGGLTLWASAAGAQCTGNVDSVALPDVWNTGCDCEGVGPYVTTYHVVQAPECVDLTCLGPVIDVFGLLGFNLYQATECGSSFYPLPARETTLWEGGPLVFEVSPETISIDDVGSGPVEVTVVYRSFCQMFPYMITCTDPWTWDPSEWSTRTDTFTLEIDVKGPPTVSVTQQGSYEPYTGPQYDSLGDLSTLFADAEDIHANLTQDLLDLAGGLPPAFDSAFDSGGNPQLPECESYEELGVALEILNNGCSFSIPPQIDSASQAALGLLIGDILGGYQGPHHAFVDFTVQNDACDSLYLEVVPDDGSAYIPSSTGGGNLSSYIVDGDGLLGKNESRTVRLEIVPNGNFGTTMFRLQVCGTEVESYSFETGGTSEIQRIVLLDDELEALWNQAINASQAAETAANQIEGDHCKTRPKAENGAAKSSSASGVSSREGSISVVSEGSLDQIYDGIESALSSVPDECFSTVEYSAQHWLFSFEFITVNGALALRQFAGALELFALDLCAAGELDAGEIDYYFPELIPNGLPENDDPSTFIYDNPDAPIQDL